MSDVPHLITSPTVWAHAFTKQANRKLAGESACRQIVTWIDWVRLFGVSCSALLRGAEVTADRLRAERF